MKHIKKFMALSSALGASVLYVGCGAAPGGQPPVGSTPGGVITTPISTACTAGQVNAGWGCVSAPDLQTACTYIYRGQMITAPGTGVPVCRTVYRASISFRANGLPLLPSSDVTGYNAFNTGLQVRAGDKMEFYGTGGWGSSSVSVKRSGLRGNFRVYTTNYNCDEIDLDGQSDEGVPATHQGQPAALYGTDGTERFLIGSNVTKQIVNNGFLRLGFNTPYVQNGCSTLNIQSLRITRCADVSGNTYTCQ